MLASSVPGLLDASATMECGPRVGEEVAHVHRARLRHLALVAAEVGVGAVLGLEHVLQQTRVVVLLADAQRGRHAEAVVQELLVPLLEALLRARLHPVRHEVGLHRRPTVLAEGVVAACAAARGLVPVGMRQELLVQLRLDARVRVDGVRGVVRLVEHAHDALPVVRRPGVAKDLVGVVEEAHRVVQLRHVRKGQRHPRPGGGGGFAGVVGGERPPKDVEGACLPEVVAHRMVQGEQREVPLEGFVRHVPDLGGGEGGGGTDASVQLPRVVRTVAGKVLPRDHEGLHEGRAPVVHLVGLSHLRVLRAVGVGGVEVLSRVPQERRRVEHREELRAVAVGVEVKVVVLCSLCKARCTDGSTASNNTHVVGDGEEHPTIRWCITSIREHLTDGGRFGIRGEPCNPS